MYEMFLQVYLKYHPYPGCASSLPAAAGAGPGAASAVTEADDLGALPEGWEERVHTDGRIFFIDHSQYTHHHSLLYIIFIRELMAKCIKTYQIQNTFLSLY